MSDRCYDPERDYRELVRKVRERDAEDASRFEDAYEARPTVSLIDINRDMRDYLRGVK